jgi:hypothetical protein
LLNLQLNTKSHQVEIKPLLLFGFDIDAYENEIIDKGYCSDVHVVLPDFSKFKICFYDLARLSQSLEDEKYIAEPGLIILPQLSKKNMELAVFECWLDGFFDNLKPIQ